MVFTLDRVILKSGKIITGNVTEEDGKVILKTKYGKIIYNKSDVKVEKHKDISSNIKDLSTDTVSNKGGSASRFVNYLLTTKSGRKIEGRILEKNGKLFLYEAGGVVQLNDFVISSKVEIGKNNVQGEVVAGERCNILMKSGRAFSGIIEEKKDYLQVTSRIGTVRLNRKYLVSLERTGMFLDLRKKAAPVETKSNMYSSKLKSKRGNRKGRKNKSNKKVELVYRSEASKEKARKAARRSNYYYYYTPVVPTNTINYSKVLQHQMYGANQKVNLMRNLYKMY